jgi:hypothetical protein
LKLRQQQQNSSDASKRDAQVLSSIFPTAIVVFSLSSSPSIPTSDYLHSVALLQATFVTSCRAATKGPRGQLGASTAIFASP